jgi:hypothetical protein
VKSRLPPPPPAMPIKLKIGESLKKKTYIYNPSGSSEIQRNVKENIKMLPLEG